MDIFNPANITNPIGLFMDRVFRVGITGGQLTITELKDETIEVYDDFLDNAAEVAQNIKRKAVIALVVIVGGYILIKRAVR